MKNNIGATSSNSSVKNLCDKCGGSYATLAALISHKKSCKGTPNKRKVVVTTGTSTNKPTRINDEDVGGGDEECDTERDRVVVTPSQSHENSLKMMAANADAIAHGSVHSLSSWQNDFLPPSLSSMTPDMNSLLESLAPIFASANLERNDCLPNSDEQQQQQQAALLMTQQMMFFHMLQQLQSAPHIPPLPLIAAAAAAAAQQQQSSMSSTSPPVRPVDNSADNEDANLKERATSNISRSLFGASNEFSVGEVNNKSGDKEPDELKRPPSASSTSTSLSASHTNTNTRKLLSSILDLKDTNPDAPLPPMMSPPKTDSSEPVSFNEPNTLELLQKHTEQALQNTMSGGSFLLNGLSAADNSDILNFRKGKDGKEDPACRHRCKFCGKVFGSDSALQIHIRSHTGERPFKCNVCGNRFTTKGNLKVHFQRHKAKYPNVKMNPHPVPEHLDKFHPPLEPPSNSQSPPPAPPGLFTSTPSGHFAHSNTLHIPAIFSSTLIPFGSEDSPKKDTLRSSDEKSKSKVRSSFDFEELYKRGIESKLNHSISFSADDSSKSDQSDIGQSDNDENMAKANTNEDEDSDTDVDSVDGAIDLQKKSGVNGHWTNKNKITNKDKDCDLTDESNDKIANMSKEDDGSKADIDSDDEMSDDNTQFGMDGNDWGDIEDQKSQSDLDVTSTDFQTNLPYLSSLSGSSTGAIPPSFGLMGLPFGVDPSVTLPLPGQHFARNVDKESELGDAAAKDPIFYQNLLPKPGSTDNTWETLMEVQKASETVKLQQLVDNIEHKLNDPNQCIICQRVLSCKSALQMHYRTHTGERPFKCKICGRAFTTKGNLKTHMGVHRVKPPLRMLHQCPICHKQFTNALVLQQHIRLHSVEPNAANSADINQELISEIKGNPLFPPNFSRALFPSTLGNPFSLSLNSPSIFSPSFITELANQQLAKANPLITSFPSTPPLKENASPREKIKEERPLEEEKECEQNNVTKKEKRKIENKANKSISMDDGSSVSDSTEIDDELEVIPNKRKKIDTVPSEEKSSKEGEENTLSALENHVIKSTSHVSPQSKSYYSKSDSSKESVLDLTPKSDDSKNSSDSRSYHSTPFAGLPYHPTGRPNTTCRICLKTFACFSALEIHYRSHTKERPFKCEVCDRGFSTKGNMKQHMLTHKIRDLPPDLYTTVSPSSNTTLGNFLTSNNISKLMGKQSTTNSSNNSNNSSRVSSPHTPNGNNSNSVDSDKMARNTESPACDQSSTSSRTSGSNKHLCTICNKPFSSGSALQIHMRTHTGDKPFKCTICGRAFTTKGNLKVHMGTHMWNNNPSRRGRRMSIDLPNLHVSPPNPPTSKLTPELPPTPNNANSELFFPYLSPQFLNNPDANQIALQQMMFMKMMANQQSQLPTLSHDKRTIGSNEEDMDNHSLNGDNEDEPKQLMCEPEIDLMEGSERKHKEYFETNANEDDDEEDNKSYKSDISNQQEESNGWTMKQWKMPCTICSHISTSAEDLQEHIKAHLHAAVTASSSSETKSTAKPAGVIS